MTSWLQRRSRTIVAFLLATALLSLAPPGITRTAVPAAAATTTAAAANAVQNLDFCRATTMLDIQNTAQAELPFTMNFYGTSQRSVRVHKGGLLSFNGLDPLARSASGFNLNEWIGNALKQRGAPTIIAQLAEGGKGALASYGSSADRSTFCALWIIRTPTNDPSVFQILITDRSNTTGTAGDVDVTLNYDQVVQNIEWQSLAGLSDGTLRPGTFHELALAGPRGVWEDNGSAPLVAGSRPLLGQPAVPGRYQYAIRNADFTDPHVTLSGTVSEAGRGAWVDVMACAPDGLCYEQESKDSAFTFPRILPGRYLITLKRPVGPGAFAGSYDVEVLPGRATVLPAPLQVYGSVGGDYAFTATGSHFEGIHTIPAHSPTAIRVTGCPGVERPSYSLDVNRVRARSLLPMVEGPAGVYRATIAPLNRDLDAYATVETNVPATCGGSAVRGVLSIETGGFVTDQWGTPLPGARVTLRRGSSASGPFDTPPVGSYRTVDPDLLQPNVKLASAPSGRFGWQAAAGWYTLSAESPGCAPVTTPPIYHPDQPLNRLLTLHCPGVDPTLSATPTPTPTPTPTATPTPTPTASTSLTASATPRPTPSTTPTSTSAAIKTLPPSSTPSSTPASSPSSTPAATATAVPPTTTIPAPAPTVAKAESKVSVTTTNKRVRRAKLLRLVLSLSTSGSQAGTIVIYDGTQPVKTVTSRAGTTRLRTTLKNLRPGRHTITARFSGNDTTLAATSSPLVLRVR